MAAKTGVSPLLQESRKADGPVVLGAQMERLRARYAPHRTWADKSVRSVSTDKRHAPDGPDRSASQGCVDSLQHAMKLVSQQSLLQRLEAMASSLGLTYTVSGSGTDRVVLSGDMFFVDVVMDKTGSVCDVKVAHQSEAVSCTELTEVLSCGDFKTFMTHLEGLQKMYQVTGDKKVKTKAFLALQSLERDLNVLAQLQNSINGVANYIHKSPLGILLPRVGGIPMKLIYFVSPYDLLDKKSKSAHPMTVEAITEHHLGCSVTVGIETSAPNKLQTMPLMTVNKDPEGKSLPFFTSLTNLNSHQLPARFVLELTQPVPLALSTANNISSITGQDVTEGLTKDPLLKLLLMRYSNGKLMDTPNLHVTLPDHKHLYYLSGVNGGSLDQPGVLVSRIAFTHPTHVPAILNCLRQQLLFNTVIASCIRPQAVQDEEEAVVLDMTCMSMQQLSVACEHPCFPSLMVVELDLSDMTSLKCQLLTEQTNYSLCSDDFAGKIFQRCLSIPITIRCILYKGRETLQRLYLEALAAKQRAEEASQIALPPRQSLPLASSHHPGPVPPRPRPPSYPGHAHPALVSAGIAHGGGAEGRGLLADLMSPPPGTPITTADKINSNPLLATLLDHDSMSMSLGRSLSQDSDVAMRVNRTMGGGNPPGMGMGGVGAPPSNVHGMGSVPMSMGSGGGMAMASNMPGANMCGIGMGGPNVSMGGPNVNMGGANLSGGGANMGVGGAGMVGGANMGVAGPGMGVGAVNSAGVNLPPPGPAIDSTDSPMLSKLLEEHTSLSNTGPGAIAAPKPQHQQKKVRKRRSTSDILSGRSPKHRTSDSDIMERAPSVDLDSSSSPFEGGLPCGGSGSSGSSGMGGPSVIDLTEDLMAGGLGALSSGASGGGSAMAPESTLKKLAERVDSLIPPSLLGEAGRGGGGNPGSVGGTSELQALLADNSNSPQLPRASPVSKNENASTSLEELLAGSGEVGEVVKPDPGSTTATGTTTAAATTATANAKSSKARPFHMHLPVDINLHNELFGQEEVEEKSAPPLGHAGQSSSLDWGQEWNQHSAGAAQDSGRGPALGKAPLRHSVSTDATGGGSVPPPSSSSSSSFNRKDITGIFEKFEKLESVKTQTPAPPAPKNARADCGDRESSKLKLKLPAAAFKGSMADSLTSSLASSQSASSFSSSPPVSHSGRLASTPSSAAATFDFKSDEEEDSPLFSFTGGLSVYSQSPTRLQISAKAKPGEVSILTRGDKRHRDLRSSGKIRKDARGSESKHRREKDGSKKERKKRKMTSSSQYAPVKEPVYRAAAVEDHKSVSKIKLRLSKAPSGKTTITPVGVKTERLEPPPSKKQCSSSLLVDKSMVSKHDFKTEVNKHDFKTEVNKHDFKTEVNKHELRHELRHELSKHELKAELRHIKHEGKEEVNLKGDLRHEAKTEMREVVMGNRKGSSSHKMLAPKALHKLSQPAKSSSPQRAGMGLHGGRAGEMGRHKSEWSRTLSKSNDPKLVTKATIRLKPLNIPNSSSGSVNVSASKSGLNSLASGKSAASLALTPGSTALSLSSILPDAPSASSIASLPPIPRLSANSSNNSNSNKSVSSETNNSNSNNNNSSSGNSGGSASNSYSSSGGGQGGSGNAANSGGGENRLKLAAQPSSNAATSTTPTSAATANSNPTPPRSRKGSLSAIVDKLSKTCSTSVHVSSTPGGEGGKSADKPGPAEGSRPREGKMCRSDPRLERSLTQGQRADDGADRRASLDPRLARRALSSNGPSREHGKGSLGLGNYGNLIRPSVPDSSRLPHLSAISKSRSVSEGGSSALVMHRYNNLGAPRTASPLPRLPPPCDSTEADGAGSVSEEAKAKVWTPWDRPERNSSPSLPAPPRPRPPLPPTPPVEKQAEVDRCEGGGREVGASPALPPPSLGEGGVATGGEVEKGGSKPSPRGSGGRESPSVRVPTPTAKFNGDTSWDKVVSGVPEEKKAHRSPTPKPVGLENHEAAENAELPVKRRKLSSKMAVSPRSDTSSPDNGLVIDCFSNGPSPKPSRQLSPAGEEDGVCAVLTARRESSSPRVTPAPSPKVTARPSPKVASEPSPKVPPPASCSSPKVNSSPPPKVCQSPAHPPPSGTKEMVAAGAVPPPGDNHSPCVIDDELMDEALMGLSS